MSGSSGHRFDADDARERVLHAVDARADELVASAAALIRIPSVDPTYPGVSFDEHIGGEAAANDLMAMLYARSGCRVERVEIAPRRPNVVGVIAGADPTHGRSLIFNGHVDVVPPGRNRGLAPS